MDDRESRDVVRRIMREVWLQIQERERAQRVVRGAFMAGLRGDAEPPADL
jgi:hypothetical protein